jgi:hypothetical protein
VPAYERQVPALQPGPLTARAAPSAARFEQLTERFR